MAPQGPGQEKTKIIAKITSSGIERVHRRVRNAAPPHLLQVACRHQVSEVTSGWVQLPVAARMSLQLSVGRQCRGRCDGLEPVVCVSSPTNDDAVFRPVVLRPKNSSQTHSYLLTSSAAIIRSPTGSNCQIGRDRLLRNQVFFFVLCLFFSVQKLSCLPPTTVRARFQPVADIWCTALRHYFEKKNNNNFFPKKSQENISNQIKICPLLTLINKRRC